MNNSAQNESSLSIAVMRGARVGATVALSAALMSCGAGPRTAPPPQQRTTSATSTKPDAHHRPYLISRWGPYRFVRRPLVVSTSDGLPVFEVYFRLDRTVPHHPRREDTDISLNGVVAESLSRRGYDFHAGRHCYNVSFGDSGPVDEPELDALKVGQIVHVDVRIVAHPKDVW